MDSAVTFCVTRFPGIPPLQHNERHTPRFVYKQLDTVPHMSCAPPSIAHASALSAVYSARICAHTQSMAPVSFSVRIWFRRICSRAQLTAYAISIVRCIPHLHTDTNHAVTCARIRSRRNRSRAYLFRAQVIRYAQYRHTHPSAPPAAHISNAICHARGQPTVYLCPYRSPSSCCTCTHERTNARK